MNTLVNGNISKRKCQFNHSVSSQPQARHWKPFRVAWLPFGAVLAFVSMSAVAGPNDPAAPAKTVKPVTAETTAVMSEAFRRATPLEREHWRKSVLAKPKPKKGCFTSTYPSTEWIEVPCKEPPHKLYPPRDNGSTRVETVGGNSGDFSATVSGHITQAEGAFDSVTTTGESDSNGNANSYSLQINTDFFPTSTCAGSPNGATCNGWEQFVYESGGGGFIQYWLIDWAPANSACPAPQGAHCDGAHAFSDGWCPFQIGTSTDCVVNASGGVAAPATTAINLQQIIVNGMAAGVNGNADDSVIVSVNGVAHSSSGDSRFPDLGSQWGLAEFNVFGNGSGDAANFNPNTTLVVRTSVDSGVSTGPSCDFQSFTAETNNLILTSTTEVPATSQFPSLIFTESNVPGTVQAGCAQAISIGDTHITTFDGLHYDFQASGDFVLVDDGAGFLVQARQRSGAPTWPNAAVNKAVAVRMGRTRVSVLVEPTRLEIDGQVRELADGAVIKQPDGVQVVRHGNVYTASDAHGNRMRATANSAWVDIQILLGRAPHTDARGLLGNPKGNARTLATSTGALLREPVAFNDLYKTYGDSWRVKADASLFTQAARWEIGNPRKPLFARNLPKRTLAHARDVCKKAGVKNADLIEDCILDNAVLNDQAATNVFVHVPMNFKATIRPISVRVDTTPKSNR